MITRCRFAPRQLGSAELIDTVFLICAVLGGGVFAVRTLLQFLGGHADDADVGHVEVDHADADAGFRVLSLQGLSAFFMMFGLSGLALVRQSGVAPALALPVAALPGIAAVWLIGRLFVFMTKLQSSGTMNMHAAIGQEGSIYLTVQSGGVGKVQVVVQGRLGVFDAREHDGKELATGKRVRVVGVATGDVLVVQEIEPVTGTQLTPL